LHSDTTARRWRSRPAVGILTACATALAVTVSAPAYGAQTARQPSPSLANAPVSGRLVSGAVFGSAARNAAGQAATGFVQAHQSMLDASRSAAGSATAPGSVTSQASQLHDWWGSFPDTNSGTGVIATQSVSSTLRLSNGNDILYAPTMKPADGSCIEVVTVHTTSTPQVWAWDWCGSVAPAAEVNVNSGFLSKYTTTVNGRSAYTTAEVQTDASTNTWTAYLYDYATQAWDTLFTSSGTDQSGLSYGWDMFEFYSTVNSGTGETYVCSDLQKSGTSIESSSIQIDSGGTWSPAGPGDSAWMPSASPNPSSYKCPDMQFDIVANDSDWLVDVAG
jgi:hypothetical protein